MIDACARIEGRRVHTKLSEGFLFTDEFNQYREDCEIGSRQLRNAILRAKGYTVPAIVAFTPRAPEIIQVPMFRTRKPKRGRPTGRAKKVRGAHPLVSQIQGLIAAHFSITVDDLKGHARRLPISHPRQIAMYLSRKRTDVSYPDIGFQFGGKDHTTVMHAVNEVEKRITDGDEKTVKAISFVHSVMGA